MLLLKEQLELERCPHGGVGCPNLAMRVQFQTPQLLNRPARSWFVYACQRCGGVVTAAAKNPNNEVREVYPAPVEVEATVPPLARCYLAQALVSFHVPAGAVMLAASAVDAMLKVKGYTEGSLYDRINKAATDHMITDEMARWAHQVRLDANDQRHADSEVALPSEEDARRSVEFASALAQFLFALPARVEKGLAANGVTHA